MKDLLPSYIHACQSRMPELEECFQAESEYFQKTFKSTDNVLDLGCGIRPAVGIANFVKEIVAVDIDQRVLDMVSKNKPENLSAMCMDARGLAFQNGYFDLAYTSFNTLGGFSYEDTEQVVREMTRVVKPKGKVINISWKQDDYTTKFLERFYPAVGLVVKEITPKYTLNSSGVWRRISPEEFMKLYSLAGIKKISFLDLGKLWLCAEGIKLLP